MIKMVRKSMASTKPHTLAVYKRNDKNNEYYSISSPIGNTNQRVGEHGPLNISEVGSGAMEE
jgi:hypothetical protein